MTTFNFAAKVTVSCWTEVEAATEEEAAQIAKGRELADVHVDGSFSVKECWHMDDDGMPYDLHVDD